MQAGRRRYKDGVDGMNAMDGMGGMNAMDDVGRKGVLGGMDAEWHAKRAKGLGGSDAGIIAGNPHGSLYQLWLLKTGRVQPSEHDNEAMYWGRVFEDPVARRYAQETGLKIRRAPMVTSTEYPWMIANVDRVILGDRRGPGVLEVKTTNAYMDLPTDADTLPDWYFAQIQHYLIVKKYSWGAFSYLKGGQVWAQFEVAADNEYQAALIEAERAFWRLVETDTPPEVTGQDETALRRLHPVDQGHVITIDDQIVAGHAERLDEVKTEIRALELEEKRLRALLEQEMGEAAEMALPGFGRVTWKNARPVARRVYDEEAMRADNVLDRYSRIVEMPGARRFLIHRAKER